MQIVIDNIKMPIKHSTDDVIATAREIVRSNCSAAKNFRIYKQSIDARRKNNIHYVYAVTAETDKFSGEAANIRRLDVTGELEIPKKSIPTRPIVVGTGPCGLFAALILAESGNPPLLIERGEAVDDRAKSIRAFWETGRLDPNSNVQFGEGGAGTFSDGKLNTRIGDLRQRHVLQAFAKFGAPEDILYKAKPHIGTDVLRNVIKNMREHLIALGTEIRFNTQVTDIKIANGGICEVELNHGETVKADSVIAAIGHSSRDTYAMLKRRGVEIIPKPFAVGVRIEHSQKFIDRLQYGAAEGLPPADYRVVYNGKDRSCYSFCMCPGGVVVNASSEPNMLAVNGMSEHSRDGECANSALVVTVSPADFEGGALGGVEFQRKYERLAYEIGKGRAPVQLAADFLADRESVQLGDKIPSVTGGFELAELKHCLPEFVTNTLRDGLRDFERRMSGFASGNALLTGIESRTSAPIRMPRNENFESVNVKGLYPAGEGAGYAGGIVSAAVDGIRAAFAILENKGQI